MQYDDNQLQKIGLTKQISAIKDLDRAGEVQLRSVDMERKQLHIPPLLEPEHVDESNDVIFYELDAQKGESEIIPGLQTPSNGYNGSLLGPVLRMRKGQQVNIATSNHLDDETTYHWHGLMVPDDADGGPMSAIKHGGKNKVEFEMLNDAGTYWFHPHPHFISAEQIYYGLTGLIINEDERSQALQDRLPHVYGIDDIPLIIWDRFIGEDGTFQFEDVFGSDGNRGDILLLNGTPMSKVEVEHRYVRFRLVNAANVTNFRVQLSNGGTFYQVATDGGFLNHPVGVDGIVLSPAERAEIIIDLDMIDEDQFYLMMNEFKALEINVTNKKEVVQFSPNMSLREEILPIIQVKDIHHLPTKLFMFSGTDENVSINNMKFEMGRIDEYQTKGERYVWRVINVESESGGMVHNFHTHGTQFRVIARNGQIPPKNEMGYKDTIALNPGEEVHLLIEFPIASTYMYHCHNFAHENNGMMGHIQITD